MSELTGERADRIRRLREIIEELHAGNPPESVKHKLRELVREIDYSEIVSMEQELLAEGIPVEKLLSMCDLHSQVTREELVQLGPKALPPGHPADTFRRENEALRGVIARMREIMAAIEALPDAASAEEQALALREAFNSLMDVEKHYQRKEHTLFPVLERHGITAPPQVMWAKDDEVRALLKQLGAALDRRETAGAAWKAIAAGPATAALAALEEMIYKEDNILLPMCLENFTEEEWADVWVSSPRYGWCLVEPGKGYQPPRAALQEAVKRASAEGVQLPTGHLTLEQVKAIFSTLPVDVTFVDADDRVAFFSEGGNRIFARSTAVIGRKVQHCHPPHSVGVVERILSDFREGRQNVAEFWINLQGRFVYIRYFAVRDGSGRYLGTLEVTQDVTGIRALQGERRLLQYDC